ncbi:hypothetical protein A2Y85_06705 [candidate division WOR-3 bacterium RBG_13_43_14]|uniref:PorV/PorQ family protein n=1 Tax=candidate division WOR-3 bacterium RBG_13_43_14 TaxID=1802590 RepID=A0A1F4UG60_UNCW3|nr:MAG: hypothetical protein A2Y85_06705 [candidate division WOR-3 bacterium RBG_13_43_14]
MQRFIALFLPIVLLAAKYAGDFQELGIGGRASGMGGTGIAQFHDPATIYYNPGGSFFAPKSILIMHSENFAGIVRNEYIGVILPQRAHIFGLAVQYISVGDIKLTTLPDTTELPGDDNQPYAYDTVGTNDIVLYLEYARGLMIGSDPHRNGPKLAYGANIKIYYRDLVAITGYGGGLDLGCAFTSEYFQAGLAVRDFILAPLIWDNGTRETILPKIMLGVSPVIPFGGINSRLTIACDFIKEIGVSGFSMKYGFEFCFRDVISGRAGFNAGRFTVGIGLAYKKFRLDYALLTHSELSNTHRVSLGYIF